MPKNHPASFDFKWKDAHITTRAKYAILTDHIKPRNEKEKNFLLWMANQDDETRTNFKGFFS